jgi:formamidopyrimidine-DNA glycosylase
MPELPEVETVARGVDQRVRGERIDAVWFGSHHEPFKTPAAIQAQRLDGLFLLGVHRTGKHIVCELGPEKPVKARAKSKDNKDNDSLVPTAQWIVHLGMTGRLLVTTADAPVVVHTHARLTLASGRELRFVDPRRFGRLEFRDLNRSESFQAAGADPLLIGKDEFAALFRGRKLVIKAALLNQSLLSGVGNIYADESLFHAGIRPRRMAGRLKLAELERLRLALRQVLEDSIRLGGSSVSDYVDANGVRGFYQLQHCVYLRTGEPCRSCQSPIQRVIVAGRGTHFCLQCQH